MAKALLIAEKPSLMREIQKIYQKHKAEIGIEIDFMAQAGHLVGLKSPKEIDKEKYGKWSLGSFPTIYPYAYKINEGKEKLVKQIKDGVKSGAYDFIIHAGDPDGEGELLVRLVLDYIGNRLPVKRFWTNDLAEPAILGALKNLQPDSNYDHIYEAALVRQHSDYQFGMNGTGTITCKAGGNLCRIGRVKAAIVALIVMRELEILNYVEKKTYKPAFRYKGCEFILDQAFDKPEMAMKIFPKTEYADIPSAKYEVKRAKAPKLFKLSTLQTEAHSRFGWSGQKTLDVLQELYEAKAVSYPRTGCEYISSQVDIGRIAKHILSEVEVDTSLLVREPSDVSKDKAYANDKAIAAEGHTAIIPTGEGLKSASSDQRALYELICRRFLAIFGPVKETMSVKVTGIPTGTKDPYIFSESYDLKPGYELILNPDYKMKQSCGIKFEDGQSIHPIEFFVKEITTQKPSRYNDGTLIKALETPEKYEGEEGAVKYKIGTPATRATIIEECQKNGYFRKDKGSFVASDKAIAIYEAYKNVPLFIPIESGKWEEMFDQIRSGKMDYQVIEDALIAKMQESVEMLKAGTIRPYEIEDSTEKKTKGRGKGKTEQKGEKKMAGSLGDCPVCHNPVQTGKFGVYCSGKCGMLFGKVFGKELSENEWRKVLAGESIRVTGLVSKKGTTYDATLKPGKIDEFTYTGKDGTKKSGKSIHFDLEFDKDK